MFKPTNQLLTILLGVLAIQVGSYDCAKPLPEQLHCSSTLFYKNSDSLDIYNVDEYLDIRAKRSSVRVEDKTQGETRIYYNQVAPKSSAPRRLIMYEPASKNCKPLTIGSWQLSDLRRLAIYMGDMYELKEEFIEIPIGPSVLLFAVNNNLAQFKYVGDTYSKARLSQMHVYSYELLFTRPDSRRMWINLMVHVPKQANSIRVPQVDEPLVEYMDTMEGSTSVARVVLVAACIMNMEPSADDYIAAHDLKKGGKLDPTKLDEDDFCPRDRLLFSVHYNIVSEHLPGTLTGKTFNQARFVHDFNQEPFLLPIGIGCWGSGNMGDDNGAGAKGQLLRQLAIGHPERFSAVYITSQGFKGALFVAYDRAYNLLRLDRDGRKSIFDLANRKSYHVGEFSSSSSGAVGAEIERCVILDMDWMSNQQPDSELSDDEQHQLEEWLDQQPHDPLGSSSGDGSILEKVIGLSHDETRQHYLGTRIIDHVAYEVFESEIRPLESGHFNVPLSLVRRRTLQKTPEANGHLRMFITFYATIESDSVAMLKYIDLWMFDTKSETRYIVNRLKFIEFSWSLDVEPVNDVESQASGDGFGLFSIEPCYQNRASQAELVLDFRQFTLSSNSQPSLEQGLSLLKANEELIRNNIAQVMVNKLELERLNVVDLKVEIRPDGNLISSSRIVELRNGLLEMKQLGFIDYANDFNHIQDYVKQKKNDAHWLRDCQLTSISWPESNWAAYCPLSARCLILSPQEGVKKYFAAPSREKAEICVVYSLKYSTVDTSWTESGAVVARTDLRMWRLSAGFFSLSLDYWRGNAFNSFVYEARPLLRKFHVLDSMLGRQDQAYATGLRHTTADEDDAGINTNLRVALASSKMDGFQHCQLACQMDERCASFSYCTAPKSSTAAASSPSSTSLRRGEECVLSSLRLTRNRLASLVEAHTATKEARVELRVTNECESQSFIMMRDDSCSLHPRDFLADYKMASEKFSDRESGSGGDNQTTQQASGQGAPATNGNDEEHRTQVTANQANPLARSVSLEECAGSSFERCAYQDPEHNQFIYCPLESLCLLQSNDDSSSNATKKQMTAGLDCFVYIKRPSSIYLRKHFSQVSFNFRMPKANEKTGVPMLSAVSKITEKNQYNESISRDLAGLDAENCARECNLHRSKCLAFDSCWVAGHYFCRLYSVRSPLSGVSAYLPQSRLEKSMDEMFVYKLISTSACSHFSLKPGYFEVRLRQILDKEPKAMDNLDGADGLGPLSPNDEQPEPKPANEVRLDEMEGLIMSSDEEKSKLELEEVKKETEQNIEAVQEEEHRASVSHSIGIHFIFLLVGLLLGCTGAIFKEELAHVIRIAASRSTQMATGSSIGSSNQFPFTRHDDTTGIVLEDSLQQTSDEAHNAAGGMA